MPRKPNYNFEKHRKELAKQKKKEEKRQRKAEKRAAALPDAEATQAQTPPAEQVD